jgi:hypothetical protein
MVLPRPSSTALSKLVIPINLFGGYPLCGFSDPPDPPKPLTPTHKYPHPQHRCGYLEGPGLGSPEIPQGYPCQSLDSSAQDVFDTHGVLCSSDGHLGFVTSNFSFMELDFTSMSHWHCVRLRKRPCTPSQDRKKAMQPREIVCYISKKGVLLHTQCKTIVLLTTLQFTIDWPWSGS